MKRIKRGEPPKRRDVDVGALQAIVERGKTQPLSPDDYDQLKSAVETLAFLTAEIESKGSSIERLRYLLFGSKSEKASNVLGGDKTTTSKPRGNGKPRGAQGQKKGHGKNGASAYPGADKVHVRHPSLCGGAGCPGCTKGKVYPLQEPSTLLRVRGMAPLFATLYSRDRLRCNLCGEVFTAPAPEGVGDRKYDETATSMVALLKYGTGLPFNRIEKLQEGLGIPMPAATQWDLVHDAATKVMPAFDELVREAAQGKVLHNDDTSMKVLELLGERRADPFDDELEGRTGVFTTGIVSTRDERLIALFLTGRKHAGENLKDVLAHRAAELPPPIQMSDALSRNAPGDTPTLKANCNSHGRRYFVNVVEDFPEECRYVIETLGEVFHHDAIARRESMSDDERLRFHQEKSKPLMDELDTWMSKQIDEHIVEPNSGLGEAIEYMQEHWDKLTLFLSVPGAPLDNNVVERALKKAILHRKNALFYKTKNGARVGDAFMSLIYTTELCGGSAFDYLVALLRHHRELRECPAAWTPWRYVETLAGIATAPGPLP